MNNMRVTVKRQSFLYKKLKLKNNQNKIAVKIVK